MENKESTLKAGPLIKLNADKLQAIHRLSAVLALDNFNVEYVSTLCQAVEMRLRVNRVEQLTMQQTEKDGA